MIPWTILRERMLALGFPVEEVMRLQEDLHARDLEVPDPFPDTEPAQFVPAPAPCIVITDTGQYEALYPVTCATCGVALISDDATPVPE